MRKAIFGLFCLVDLHAATFSSSAQQTAKIGLLTTYAGQFTDAGAQMDNGTAAISSERC
jgi:hypothetical protein